VRTQRAIQKELQGERGMVQMESIIHMRTSEIGKKKNLLVEGQIRGECDATGRAVP